MATLAFVTKSLEEVVRLELSVKASIQDINACEGPLSSLQLINTDARKNIQEIKRTLEELETFAKERDREDDKKEILREVDSQRSQLEGTISSLRRANLQCQLRIEHLDRGGLISPGTASDDGPRHRSAGDGSKKKTVDKERLVNSVSDVTDSMMELSRKLTVQVEHSSAAVENLISSSKTLQESQEEVKSVDAHINASKKLLTKFERRQLTDHLLIFLALVFFYATVVYIVKKRLWPAAEFVAPD